MSFLSEWHVAPIYTIISPFPANIHICTICFQAACHSSVSSTLSCALREGTLRERRRYSYIANYVIEIFEAKFIHVGASPLLYSVVHESNACQTRLDYWMAPSAFRLRDCHKVFILRQTHICLYVSCFFRPVSFKAGRRASIGLL